MLPVKVIVALLFYKYYCIHFNTKHHYSTGPYPAATGYSYPPYNSATGGMPTTNSYPTTVASTATPPYPPQTTSSNLSMQSNTGTITEEHIHASLLSAVEDKLKKRLREVLAQSQVIVIHHFILNSLFHF